MHVLQRSTTWITSRCCREVVQCSEDVHISYKCENVIHVAQRSTTYAITSRCREVVQRSYTVHNMHVANNVAQPITCENSMHVLQRRIPSATDTGCRWLCDYSDDVHAQARYATLNKLLMLDHARCTPWLAPDMLIQTQRSGTTSIHSAEQQTPYCLQHNIRFTAHRSNITTAQH
jgi:hypothetical protein